MISTKILCTGRIVFYYEFTLYIVFHVHSFHLFYFIVLNIIIAFMVLGRFGEHPINDTISTTTFTQVNVFHFEVPTRCSFFTNALKELKLVISYDLFEHCLNKLHRSISTPLCEQ